MLTFFVDSITINQTDLSPFITGAAQPKLTQDNLNRLEIPMPSEDIIRVEIDRIRADQTTLSNCKALKERMEQTIKDVIDGVWGVTPTEGAESGNDSANDTVPVRVE